MSAMRQEYFVDLLRDCKEVCERQGIEPEDQAIVTAALIFSDSMNGIRKALMTPSFVMAQQSRRENQY